MFLVSVSGSADVLATMIGDDAAIDSQAALDSDGQWTVIGYVDADLLARLNARNVGVTVIDDEASVAAEFSAVLNDIEPDQ